MTTATVTPITPPPKRSFRALVRGLVTRLPFLRSDWWRARFEATKYVAFGSFIITMALASLIVFAFGVFGGEHYGGDVVLKRILVFILFVVTFVPAMIVVQELRELYKAKVKKDPEAEPRHDRLVELTIHAVPYGILALSMLFEHHKVAEGKVEGMAALAAIMILFILAELGLFLFENIKSAKAVSVKLESALPEMNRVLLGVSEKLRAMPWVESYLTLAGTERDPFTTNLKTLFDIYGRLLNEGEGVGRSLNRVLLGKYIAEEINDISGSLDHDSIPLAFRFLNRRDGGVSFFATNVGFYASFLRDAVQFLAGDGAEGDRTRVPCIAAITNALPSQFWNWPREDEEGEEYPAIAGYREAQIDGVKKRGLLIFRVILTAMGQGNREQSGRSKEISTLWSYEEWERQSEWTFLLPTNGGSDLPIKSDGLSYPGAKNELIDSISWTKGEQTSGHRRAYWISKKPPLKEVEHFKPERVWDYYCRSMHGENNRGRTEIFSINSSAFKGALNSCSDIMFLGTCGHVCNDVWEERAPGWNMALLSTMSTQTETMILAVVHRKQEIDKLWEQFRQARRELGSTKKSSVSASTPSSGSGSSV